MSAKTGVLLLLIAALIASATAIAHLSCIYLGPTCYAAQMAPTFIVDSAKAGTWVAPIGTVVVSALFLTIAAYALSGARLITPLPLLKLGVYTIATLCITRGVLPLQLWLRKPELVSDLVVYVGLVWLFTGILFWVGYRAVNTART